MVCPLCGQPAAPVFEKYGYPICDCTACRHRFADFKPAVDHVSAIYADYYFETGGDGCSDDLLNQNWGN
ncbi:MAG: hypothetical protein D6768_09870 [Chloroflexi bacterium]|nr:MAG: hypothetical protein D6768_09870 [Chloroflexota bacterium]